VADNPNRVYERLVESDEDLIGLLAVGLCEQHRMDWLARFRDQTGREPTPDQSDVFLAGVLVDRQLEAYRGRATEALARYADTVLETQLPQVAQNAVAGRVEHAAERVERSGRLSRLIFAGFLGALLFVLLVVAGLAAARYAGVNLAALTDGML
jgi:hypothetical protein